MNHRHEECRRCSAGAGPREFALPRTAAVYERDRPFRVSSITLDVAIDLEGGSIAGAARLVVERVDPSARTLVLDAVALQVSRVTVDGESTPHLEDGETLRIDLPEGPRHDVAVAYSARPRRGLYFVTPPGATAPTQAWTQLQDEDARHVFPCLDKPHEKFTFDARVAVRRGLSVLSNGSLRERVEQGDGAAFHWVMRDPVPAYLVSIVVGDFEILEDGVVDGAPITYWVPRGRAEAARRSLGRTPEMVRRFGELLGVPYPFEKYAQIVVDGFSFGGMENTTATTLYEHALLDERAALDVTTDDLVAHELAHHWFGDLVTCRDFSHGWLNEGFATFFEHLDREAHLGDADYLHGLKVDQAAYLAEAKGRYERAIVSNTYDAPIDLFDRHLYEKGGLVLHLLRRKLGDGAFFAGVGAYLRAHAHGVVETRDLMRALEASSGKALDRFFDEWVHRPGHAEISVGVTWADGVLRVTAQQPAKRVFSVTVELELGWDGGETRVEAVALEGPEAHASFACPVRPAHVAVDPRHLVVGELTTQLPADWHRATLRHGATARARWLAAAALGRVADPRAVSALTERLRDEGEHWAVRAEAATALGDARSPEARSALLLAR
ncbi:MAG: M1 family metallopeptidase, partial [Polyangiaceae bacterium]|nr:M1 family metallopeptidase [Polyangiaceae bacterium]